MSEIITTAAELDALQLAVGEHGAAAIVRECYSRQQWLIVEDEWGQFTAWSYPTDEGDNAQPVTALLERGPLTVLYRPDQPPRTEAQIKAEALREVAETAEDALSESEHQQWDYDWICYLREAADRLEGEARP